MWLPEHLKDSPLNWESQEHGNTKSQMKNMKKRRNNKEHINQNK